MIDQGIITIVVTIISTLGGAKAWEFYKRKLELKSQANIDKGKENNLFRDDLRERVAVLEQKLEDSRADNEGFLKSIMELKVSLAEFKTRIEFLEVTVKEKDKIIRDLRKENSEIRKENDSLEEENDSLKIKIIKAQQA